MPGVAPHIAVSQQKSSPIKRQPEKEITRFQLTKIRGGQ
jgi:hypothetical protein